MRPSRNTAFLTYRLIFRSREARVGRVLAIGVGTTIVQFQQFPNSRGAERLVQGLRGRAFLQPAALARTLLDRHAKRAEAELEGLALAYRPAACPGFCGLVVKLMLSWSRRPSGFLSRASSACDADLSPHFPDGRTNS